MLIHFIVQYQNINSINSTTGLRNLLVLVTYQAVDDRYKFSKILIFFSRSLIKVVFLVADTLYPSLNARVYQPFFQSKTVHEQEGLFSGLLKLLHVARPPGAHCTFMPVSHPVTQVLDIL